jgi:metabolite-proton symporter
MDRTAGAGQAAGKADPVQLRRVALASAVGTTIEWYDFFIFATAVSLVFNTQFFSNLSPASGTLAGFATLGVGFIARPLGGIIWGHFGDIVGRKAMLVASLLVMGLATVAVGLLPTYASVGLLAPILLVIIRFAQGISAGGEWAGAALMAVEHAPPEQRGRYGAYSQIGVPAGLILAQLAFFTVRNTMTPEQFAAWGWRLPFLASIVLIAVGLVVRLKVAESPVFAELREQRARSSRPIVEVFRERPRELLLAAVSFIANTTIGYVFLAYLLAYGTGVLKLNPNLMLLIVVIGSIGWLVTIVIAALWSDRAGRRPVYLVGSVLLVVWAFPFFLLIDTKNVALMVVAVLVLTAGLGLSYGPQSAWFAELFPARFRYSGASFAYAVGAVLGGGFAPLIAGALQTATGTSMAVSAYMIVVALISLGAVIAMKEGRGNSLD